MIAYVYTTRDAVWAVDEMSFVGNINQSLRKRADAKPPESPQKESKFTHGGGAPAKSTSAELKVTSSHQLIAKLANFKDKMLIVG